MDSESQGRAGPKGRVAGIPNYKNDILIDIVERLLPQGLEAWREVAAVYQRESNEGTLRRGEDLRDNWNRKLCNRMQKLTGKPGALTDRIFRCLAIERRIQDEANAAIFGADSAESSHGRDDGSTSILSNESSNNNNVPAAARGDGVDVYAASNRGKEGSGGGHPVDNIQFDNGGGDDFGDVDEEVAAANVNEAAANIDVNVTGEGGGRPCPQSLPAFGSGGNARTTAASTMGGVTQKCNHST